MTNTRNTNRLLKSVLAIVVSAMVAATAFPTTASAASVRKCYTISTGNTTVYSDTALTKKIGTIFDSDEITLVKAAEKYSKVTYPIAGGKTKTGYIKTSAILLSTKSTSYTASEKVTTYKRPGGAEYGYISKGDKVLNFGVKGKYTQVRYPVSGGYKYAFIHTTNVTKPTQKPTTKPATKPTTAPTKKTTTKGTTSNKSSKLTSPVPTKCKFNKKTKDVNWYGYHDINRNVSTKTPVYAIADGKATYKQATTKGYLTSYGNFIEFKSSTGGYKAKYCHLSRFVGAKQKIKSSKTRQKSGSTKVYVIKTKTVKKGEIIGYIGKTGNASGIHLHFELRKNGKRIDPTSVFPKLK